MLSLVYAALLFLVAATAASADYRIEVKIGIDLSSSETASIVRDKIKLFVLDGANTLEAKDPLPVSVRITATTNQGLTLLTENISQDPNSAGGLVFGSVEHSGQVFFMPIRKFEIEGDPVRVVVNTTILASKKFRNGYPFSEGKIKGFLDDASFPLTIHAARVIMIQDDGDGQEKEEIRGEFLKLFNGNRDFFRGKADDAHKAFILLSESTPGGLSEGQLKSILEFLGNLMDTASKGLKNTAGDLETDRELFDFSLSTFVQVSAQAKDAGVSQNAISTISLSALNRLNDNRKYDWCLKLFVSLARDNLLLSPENEKTTSANIINTVSDCAFSASGADSTWTKDQIARSLMSKSFDEAFTGKEFMKSFVRMIVTLDNSGVVNPTSDLPSYLLDYFNSFRSIVQTVAIDGPRRAINSHFNV